VWSLVAIVPSALDVVVSRHHSFALDRVRRARDPGEVLLAAQRHAAD
jgi:hypothetical protein